MTSVHVSRKRHIRPARQEEAERLSELALRSKALWGYPAEFLEACRSQLTLSADFINTSPVYVLEEDVDVILGFYGLSEGEGAIELLYLFVEPEAINGGYGKLLWEHAVMMARRLGHHKISIESDPHAEAFYLAMGARKIGDVASSLRPGRALPLLEFSIDPQKSLMR
jgi:GNAT superfamily N-acetyltransferase